MGRKSHGSDKSESEDERRSHRSHDKHHRKRSETRSRSRDRSDSRRRSKSKDKSRKDKRRDSDSPSRQRQRGAVDQEFPTSPSSYNTGRQYDSAAYDPSRDSYSQSRAPPSEMSYQHPGGGHGGYGQQPPYGGGGGPPPAQYQAPGPQQPGQYQYPPSAPQGQPQYGGYHSPSPQQHHGGHYPPPPQSPQHHQHHQQQQPYPQQIPPTGYYPPPPPLPQSQGAQLYGFVDPNAPPAVQQGYNPQTYQQTHTPSAGHYVAANHYQKPTAYGNEGDNEFHGYPSAPSGTVRPPSKPLPDAMSGSGSGKEGKKSSFSLGGLASALNLNIHDAARKLFPATSTHVHYAGGVGGGIGGLDGELHTDNPFDSFAPPRNTNGVKWFVEGRDYMHAVSVALEEARESIWIMDWWLSPELYLRRPPAKNEQYRLDRMLLAAAMRGVQVRVMVYKEVEQALTLDSHHTKHALEGMHANISVLRHPDHVPDATNIASGFSKKLKDGYQAGDILKGIYGIKDGKVLYWAHHEKLVLIDGYKVFMGGLDLCFGRWDTNEHPLSDVHPEDITQTVFPGQDYNNARIMDFNTVKNYNDNKLSRQEYPRMGWTDVALCFQGPSAQDLKQHFVERWNFIWGEKYAIRKKDRYPKLVLTPWPGETDGLQPREHKDRVKHKLQQKLMGDAWTDGVKIQVLRSASSWSHGTSTTEHSICNAYIDTILKAEHFVYIENQFFITATNDKQNPIINQIGAAIVQRIYRASQEGRPFKVIILIPAVPGFAGDLQADGSLGTRAIMEFQYRSINKDRGFSIIEQLTRQGVKWENYLHFYNLRNYDRINTQTSNKEKYDQASNTMAQQQGQLGQGAYPPYHGPPGNYQSVKTETWNSVAKCCMLNGPDLRTIPWSGTPEEELAAFVSEELYIHTKLLIADDRKVICGSANINDRSQLGDHDSEIAVLIEDPTPLQTTMGGHPFTASNFAATLRRQIFRKHLGLIPAQNLARTDENCFPFPAPNLYDFGSPADYLVADPLSPRFWETWTATANYNTYAFRTVFHAVPDDTVRNWKQYEEFYSKHFREEQKDKNGIVTKAAGKEKVCHVVRDQGEGRPPLDVKAVKDILYQVKGHLVHMPLHFLEEEDIAQEGVGLNAFTETIYT